MIYRLTPLVWWGSAFELSSLPAETRSVLAVGGNVGDLPAECQAAAVAEKMPYLRVACPDNEWPNRKYWVLLEDVIGLISRRMLTPCYVHCRAGQIRSAAVAIWMAHLFHAEPIAAVVEKAKGLRPDILHDPRSGLVKSYVASLFWFLGEQPPKAACRTDN